MGIQRHHKAIRGEHDVTAVQGDLWQLLEERSAE